MPLRTTRGTIDAGPFPWRDSAVLGVGTAVVYFVLPGLAPKSVGGETDILLLGVVLGIVVGSAVRFSPRAAPVASAAAFVAISARFVLYGSPARDVLPIALVISLEIWALTVAIGLTGAQRLQRPQDVMVLLGIALGIGIVAGLTSGTVLVLNGQALGGLPEIARTWALDDAFGLVCIAPVFMTIHRPSSWSWRFASEYATVCAITAVTTFSIFRRVNPADPGLIGWPYLVILGPLWIAIRLGVAAVTPVIAVVTWFAAASTVDESGVFARASSVPIDRLAAVELFCVVIALTLLLVGVLRDARLRSMNQVRESARLLREVVDGASALVFAKAYESPNDEFGRYIMVNKTWQAEVGIDGDETLGKSDSELFSPDLAAAYRRVDREVIAADAPIVAEERGLSKGGELRYYSSSKFPLRDDHGRIWGVGAIATDTTDLVQALARERRQGELLRAVFELSPTPAMRVLLEDTGKVTALDVNSAMCMLMVAHEGALDECELLEHVHEDDVTTAVEVLSHARRLASGRGSATAQQREVRLITNDDRVVWVLMSAASVGEDPTGGAVELVAQFEDFTARRLAEEALSDQALRDAVTGLPNRRALRDRLESALQRLRRNRGMIAVLFCDLDHFKDINDTLGHQAGDDLLVHVAHRMQLALRPEDTVARLGGDEFVALGEGIVDPAAAMQMAVRLQDKVHGPWMRDGQSFRPSVSIGVAVVSDPDLSADEVLRRADLAMYRAKANGRSRVEIYERSVDEQYQHAVGIQHDLRRAIDTGSLVLHYQPIVDLREQTAVAAEALVRMVGRDGELMEPSWFVPQAETSGLIVPMGAWVAREAVEQLRRWSQEGRGISVSMNVSPSQLRDEGFANFVLAQIEAADVDPTRIAVEVTETALLSGPGRSTRELTALHRAGVRIYLDDFGTGYSSLSWLTQFPVDVVKIDRSFVEELGIDERKSAIVTALIQVSHELGFAVVAEGVETVEQADRLIELGCDRAQGYLFGRPVAVGQPPWQ